MKYLSVFVLFAFFAVKALASLEIANGAVSNITRLSADLPCTIVATNGSGTNPVLTVFYSTTDFSTNAGSWSYSNVYGQAGLGAISTNISGLTPAKYYYFRWSATETTNTAWASATSNFWTLSGAPTNQPTNPPTGIVPLMTYLDGLLAGSSNFFGTNAPAIYNAIFPYLSLGSESNFFEWLSTNTYIQSNTGNWAGTVQGVTLGTAATNPASAFASSNQGDKADSAAPATSVYTKVESDAAFAPIGVANVFRYYADTASNVFVTATGTGVVSSLGGTTHTFTVPAGVKVLSACVKWDNAAGTSFTIVMAEDGMNASADNRIPAFEKAWRKDTGSEITSANSRIDDLVNFNKETVWGLSATPTGIIYCKFIWL